MADPSRKDKLMQSPSRGVAALLKEVYHIHVHTVRGLEGSLEELQTKYNKLLKLKNSILSRGKELQKSYDALLEEVRSLRGEPTAQAKSIACSGQAKPIDSIDLGDVQDESTSGRRPLQLARSQRRTRYTEKGFVNSNPSRADKQSSPTFRSTQPTSKPADTQRFVLVPETMDVDGVVPSASDDVIDGRVDGCEAYVAETCAPDLDVTIVDDAMTSSAENRKHGPKKEQTRDAIASRRQISREVPTSGKEVRKGIAIDTRQVKSLQNKPVSKKGGRADALCLVPETMDTDDGPVIQDGCEAFVPETCVPDLDVTVGEDGVTQSAATRKDSTHSRDDIKTAETLHTDIPACRQIDAELPTAKTDDPNRISFVNRPVRPSLQSKQFVDKPDGRTAEDKCLVRNSKRKSAMEEAKMQGDGPHDGFLMVPSICLSPPAHTSTPMPPGGSSAVLPCVVLHTGSPSLFDEEDSDDDCHLLGGRRFHSPGGAADSPPKSRRRLMQTTLTQSIGRVGDSKSKKPIKQESRDPSLSPHFKMPYPMANHVSTRHQVEPHAPIADPVTESHDPNGSIDPDVRLSEYIDTSLRRLTEEEEEEEEEEASEPLLTQLKGAVGHLMGQGNEEEKVEEASVVFGAGQCKRWIEGERKEPEQDDDDVTVIDAEVEREDSFDRRPAAATPGYAYVDVVRKHAERRRLDAFACRECEEYYSALGLTSEEMKERMKACRHRARYNAPATPENFWSVDYPDTQECEERGYHHVTQAKPSRFRRRHRLQKLFSGAHEDKLSS